MLRHPQAAKHGTKARTRRLAAPANDPILASKNLSGNSRAFA
jgi:hypothetical protein